MEEKFTDTDLDGDAIFMTIDGDIIRFSARFEDHCKIHLHGLNGECRRKAIVKALDFFRNYATLLSRVEMHRALRCYHRAVAQQHDSVRSAFWHFMDGDSIQTIGKGTFQYTNKHGNNPANTSTTN